MDTTTKALPRLTKNWPAPWLSKYTALFGKMVARGIAESVAAHQAEAMIRREHDRAELRRLSGSGRTGKRRRGSRGQLELFGGES